MALIYRVVQPYGVRRDEWTVQSEHATANEAFAAVDALSRQIERTGAPSDAIELIVVNERGERVLRREAH